MADELDNLRRELTPELRMVRMLLAEKYRGYGGMSAIAKRLKVTSTSIRNWIDGRIEPSFRMKERIRELYVHHYSKKGLAEILRDTAQSTLEHAR